MSVRTDHAVAARRPLENHATGYRDSPSLGEILAPVIVLVAIVFIGFVLGG